MLDASKGVPKGGRKNRLSAQDIHKVVGTFNKQLETAKYARLVPVAEIEANDFNLNLPRYIDSTEAEDLQDISAHLQGGIPNRDVDDLSRYWAVFPGVRATLFAPADRPGYSQRKVAASDIIGDSQVGIYQKLRSKLGQEVAAAKVGISVRSARRLDGMEALPSQREARGWRTRADPFETVRQSELVPMLEAAPALTATTLLEEIQRRYPGQYENALQRRVRTWGASHGKEREVSFTQAQAHPPGRLGLSDFTHAAVLQVTIAGAILFHLLYQFALAYSGWRYVEVVLGGESFMAISSGLQNAVWMMGGLPEEHRTDSLAAAFKNKAEHDLGVSHENGSIESRQGTLKRTMEQALLLRGHRDFSDLDAYRRFVAEVFGRLNARVANKFNEERAMLRSLPARRSRFTFRSGGNIEGC